ncbi:SKA3 protein, partial [Thalassarche chlororhynchos]|nr:SKA3 protein [Thalassarche chlororhynchos]
MDVSRVFFGKLRALALTLEKEVRQLERALRREDTDYEDESPVRVLHDLHCEIRTLKEDVNAGLGNSCSEKQAIHDFMKAIEILMQRNAADLGKIRELFQKYGYKPHVKDTTEEEEEINSDSTVSVQNKSGEEKADDAPHLPACPEKPLVPKDPLRNPQLSDFGLSQYAFSRPWSAVKGQHTTNAYQENSKNRTPLKTQTPCILPKTPKCMLRMDDYECVTPKLEHFGISEHTMCMNEDYTMSLIHKTAQTSKNCALCENHFKNSSQTPPTLFFRFAVLKQVKRTIYFAAPTTKLKPKVIAKEKKEKKKCLNKSVYCYLLVKKDDHEVNVPEMTPREIMVTPGPKPKVTAENADWMASPMILVFCTPDVKIPSRTNSTVLSRSPKTNELPPPSHTGTPRFPDFETRWLKPEAKVVNSNYVHFHTLFTISSFSNVSLGFFSNTTFSYGEKIESVTKNDATNKQYIEDSIPFAVSSDEYLKHFGDPSPPKINHYDQLLNTPPPPEITKIPDDVLQILSKYNHKVDSSKAKGMETKAGNTTRYESDFTDYCNKENRGYPGFFKPNI